MPRREATDIDRHRIRRAVAATFPPLAPLSLLHGRISSFSASTRRWLMARYYFTSRLDIDHWLIHPVEVVRPGAQASKPPWQALSWRPFQCNIVGETN